MNTLIYLNLDYAKIKYFYENILKDDQTRIDFVAVYLKMKDVISTFSVTNQIKVVLAAQNVAYDSAINVYKSINEYKQSLCTK